MPILAEHVERYLRELRPERSAVMREMEELAEREGIPIVHWETGRFLATLVRALDPGWCWKSGPRSATPLCTWPSRWDAGRSSRSSATRGGWSRRLNS